MKRNLFRIYVLSGLIALLILCGRSVGALPANETFFVIRVIDGDTVELNNGEKVRLIGIDTPESVHPLKPVQYFAKEATAFTKRMVEGKRVRLEYDWQRRGKYGRLLAYVYLLDGTFLNAEIIKQGYGFAYTKYPFKYMEEFRSYEREARENNRGLWGNGGQKEFKWLLAQNRPSFQVYEMANKLWGIRYGKFIKPRLNNEELIEEFGKLRIWANEFHEEDLEKKLLEQGWQKIE